MVGSKVSSGLSGIALFEQLEQRAFFSVGVDPSFGSGGSVHTQFPGSHSSSPTDAVALKDGRLLVVGDTYPTGGGGRVVFIVYNNDGSLSKSFNGTGELVLSEANSEKLEGLPTVKLLSDGNVLVSGDGTLLKLKTNGTIDTSFGKNGFASTPDAGSDFESPQSEAGYQTIVLSDGSIRYGSFNSNTGLLRVANYSPSGKLTQSIHRTVAEGGYLTLTPTHELLASYASPVLREYRSDLSIESKFGKGGVLDLSTAYHAWIASTGPWTDGDGEISNPKLTALLVEVTKNGGYVLTTELFATSPKVPFVHYVYSNFTYANFYIGATGNSVKVTGGNVDGTQLSQTLFRGQPDASGHGDPFYGVFSTTSGKAITFQPPATIDLQDPVTYVPAGNGQYYLIGDSSTQTNGNFSDDILVMKTAYVG